MYYIQNKHLHLDSGKKEVLVKLTHRVYKHFSGPKNSRS